MDYINLILYIIIYIYCHMMRLSYSIPIEKFQFQCTGHSGTQLCVFPEQYCNDFYSECRPCSKDVCDKRDSKDFPLQCKYNCTGGSLKEDDDFIHKNANAWFIIAVILMSCLVVSAATFPIWKPYLKHKWLEEKIKTIKSEPEEEEHLLIPSIKVEVKSEDETSLQKIAEHNEAEHNEVDKKPNDRVGHATGGYCEEKLKNVNPTEEPTDAVNTIATTRAKICDVDQTSH